MSFRVTEAQLLDGQKTVTRRVGWHDLKPGERLRAVRQVRGLKKGQRQQVLCDIEVVSVRRERLSEITEEDVVKEGFPEMTRAEFIKHFRTHMGCGRHDFVTRIEFKKVT